MTRLQFMAIGRITGQGSKNHGRGGHFYEASKYLAPWRAEVTRACRKAITADWDNEADAYRVRVTFRFSRPTSHYRTGKYAHLFKPNAPGLWHTQKPDVDKLARAVLDAITKAGAIPDDARVVELRASKVWTAHPSQAHVVVEVVDGD